MPVAIAMRWAIFIILCLVVLSPVIKILRRAGYSEWWSLLLFVPVLNIAGLWWFAYARWPGAGAAAARPTLSAVSPRSSLPTS